MTDTATAAATASLSLYEKTRAKNIEKNNARLRALGLISAAEEKRSNAAAWGYDQAKSQSDHNEGDDECSSSDEEYSDEKAPTKRKKVIKIPSEPREGSRKSRRLSNLPAEHATDDVEHEGESAFERKERINAEREAMVVECREARQRAAIEVANA